jgi:hypothetical protein
VLELCQVWSGVIACYAEPAALDSLNGNDAVAVRVAPNELLLLTDRSRVGEIEAGLSATDASCLVLDVSSSFAIWALRGDGYFEAFGRLSQLKLPAAPAVVQGLVAHVPAKVLVLDSELLVLVSSALSHHLRERIVAACRDLAPKEVEAAQVEERALA